MVWGVGAGGRGHYATAWTATQSLCPSTSRDEATPTDPHNTSVRWRRMPTLHAAPPLQSAPWMQWCRVMSYWDRHLRTSRGTPRMPWGAAWTANTGKAGGGAQPVRSMTYPGAHGLPLFVFFFAGKSGCPDLRVHVSSWSMAMVAMAATRWGAAFGGSTARPHVDSPTSPQSRCHFQRPQRAQT